ncbi:hypothetical protein LCGC14_2110150 [marine sediment metagenome]|jgi:hypothetical protein|uniref:Uncharacterized protein n=1 Tax=marine sediment metagenome TaxID=412755 RepID=A0A0F9E7E8_9ZZZZ|tara:strand:+ start:35738 stop:36022 length:285 start_codon:yes stop_codon:yes gene_type:complete
MASISETPRAARIPIQALGWSLGIFFAITYTICVVFDLVFPGQSMTSLWNPLLPWVDGISLGGYALGVAETLLYGWFVALIVGPLFNFFAERSA